MRHVTDAERRARLATRQALVSRFRVNTPEEAVRAMTVFHATEPATVYLSYWARSRSASIASLDRALYTERSLVKQLAMRRTLFVFPRDLISAAWGSASSRLADTERARIAKHIVKVGIATTENKWLTRVQREVLSVLAHHPAGLTTLKLREQIPMLQAKGTGPATATPSIASQVLTYLGARADIVRAGNEGSWKTARTRWTLPHNWFESVPEPCNAPDGFRELVQRWLYTFGPGTEEDLVWWLGATKSIVRLALTKLQAVRVSLESGDFGWLLPDDLEEVPNPGPWVALLPILDPTVMGWRTRNFYLPRHREQLFDKAGNAGTTVWVDGRVVGCWVQDDAGGVVLRLFERVSKRAKRDLDSEAARLTGWLDGARLTTSLRIPAMTEGSF